MLALEVIGIKAGKSVSFFFTRFPECVETGTFLTT
jgi:hypothetical protein